MNKYRPYESLTNSLQRLQSLLLDVKDVESFLSKLAELSYGVVDPPASSGITLRRDGEPLTVVSSDGRAALLDERQYEFSEGPCLHAMRTGQPVSVSDVSTELRWSHYIAASRGGLAARDAERPK